MNAAEFLSRVVPSEGNYLTVTWPNRDKNRGWPLRSFPPAKIGEAVGWIDWAVRNNIDIYHAVAAFSIGEAGVDQRGKGIVKAPRTQGNAQLLRVLFVDADVKREGDGKDPARVFPDRRAALTWLAAFCRTTGLPRPTIIVDSGYGYHWYWLLVKALPTADWTPLAQALKSAVLANGFTGDAAIITDAARLLRPPGSVNMKSGTPVPVKVVNAGADISNAVIEQALAPWMTTKSNQATGTHGSASVSTLGPRPAHIQPGATPIGDAASAGVEKREWKFAAIAKKCEQVKRSLANGGMGDSYHLWTAHHTLAGHCVDGHEHIHVFSDQDPRYNIDANENKFAQTESEIAKKDLGAPRCTSYQSYRQGVCETCPWFGKLNSPISLGADDGDLPVRYRRRVVAGEKLIEWQDNEDKWKPVVIGDVYAPRLDTLATGGYMLSFSHELGGRTSPVSCKGGEMGHPLTVMGIVERQGLSADRHTAGRVGDFVVAWINQLRTQRVERNVSLKPFGWNHARSGDSRRLGLAIAGTHYRRDGTEEQIAGGDPKIRALYTPMGTFAEWRRAAALFEGKGKRPDLQMIVACSFASPLISLCSDVKGMSILAWSQHSGVGKTSALNLGVSVWGAHATTQSMTDTPNAVMKSLSEPRVLVRYWDELRVRKQWHDQWVEMIYVIPQGKERARMQADTTLREVGEWEALMVFTSNRPYSDVLLNATAGTDSGLYRLLEVELPKQQLEFQAHAGPILKLTDTNYGHAGRIYAKHLAQHSDEIEKQLHSTSAKIAAKLGARQEERFYVAAIATIITGAQIARNLGLFDFDVAGILEVLKTAFVKSRANVEKRALVSPKGYDIDDLLSDYYYETSDVRLRTDVFARRSGNVKVTPSAVPRGETVQVQYCEAPETLRCARHHLLEWLAGRNLPGSVIIEQLERDYNATVHRQVLGGGTRYAGPKTWVVDIPLTQAMVGLMDEDEEEDDDAAAQKLRPAAVAGNEAVL